MTFEEFKEKVLSNIDSINCDINRYFVEYFLICCNFNIMVTFDYDLKGNISTFRISYEWNDQKDSFYQTYYDYSQIESEDINEFLQRLADSGVLDEYD